MDPVTQGLLGATAASLAADRSRLPAAAVVGALAGMAPDADVLIRSSTDPLLFLEYHRHFTHSLIFIPVGALLCALAFHPLARRWLSFRQSLLFCLLGYATHAVLDACTTYGTQLLWPFSDFRVAWNWISVVDPLFTLPALGLLLVALWRRERRVLVAGALWMGLYMGVGVVQHDRAEAAGRALAATRGHDAEDLSAKPSFGNLIVWKTVYAEGGRFHVDAVRVGFETRAYSGETAERLDLPRHIPWLDPDSQQARDVERFRWFSSDYLAVREGRPDEVVDVRYSLVPNEIDPLWGIRLRRDASADAHVTYFAARDADASARRAFVAMYLGNPLPAAPRDVPAPEEPASAGEQAAQ
jgi:inner membrane protein